MNLGMDGFQFLHPLFLLLLLAISWAAWARSRRQTGFYIVPHASAWYSSQRISWANFGLGLWVIGLILITLALARPQKVEDKREVKQKGYDLFLVIDLSYSMLAEDYGDGLSRMNRWQAVQPVIQAFIQKREQDRIGMIVFSGKAYTLAPLTLDHDWLARQLEKLKPGLLDQGTAVGDGLGLALTRLDQAQRRENEARKGAFVILLTDGRSNSGVLEPLSAAEIAQKMKVPVYTIGAGGKGSAPIPVFDEQGNQRGYGKTDEDLDVKTLEGIASKTGGEFYRAADNQTIQSAFQSIDRAQKIEFQSRSYLLASELFSSWAIAGALFCLMGWIVMEGRGFFQWRRAV